MTTYVDDDERPTAKFNETLDYFTNNFQEVDADNCTTWPKNIKRWLRKRQIVYYVFYDFIDELDSLPTGDYAVIFDEGDCVWFNNDAQRELFEKEHQPIS